MASITIPGGTITSTEVSSTADLNGKQVRSHYGKDSRQVNGSNVAAKTEVIHTAKAAGSVTAFKVAVVTAPTGGDLAFTADLQKSTGGGAFATILSAVVTINSTKTDRSVTAGTVSSAAYSAGDIFQIVYAVTGSTGSQGQGALAEAFFEEQYST